MTAISRTRTAAILIGTGTLICSASAFAMTPGTYSATVPARNGELTAEVTAGKDRIEAVRIT